MRSAKIIKKSGNAKSTKLFRHFPTKKTKSPTPHETCGMKEVKSEASNPSRNVWKQICHGTNTFRLTPSWRMM